MGEQPEDIGFVLSIVKSIVQFPQFVEIDRKVDELGVLLTVKVHDEDYPIIIGRSGQTITAIKKLAKVLGYKLKSNISIKLHEEKAKKPVETYYDEERNH